MTGKNVFKGTLYYTYIESGYPEKDFEHLYDFNERKIDCVLELPNSEGKYMIHFDFITPDGKLQEHIEHDLQNIVLNGSKNLLFGMHFYNYITKNGTIIIDGNFIYEFEKEDGIHAYGCTLEINDSAVIEIFESNHLFYKKEKIANEK